MICAVKRPELLVVEGNFFVIMYGLQWSLRTFRIVSTKSLFYEKYPLSRAFHEAPDPGSVLLHMSECNTSLTRKRLPFFGVKNSYV